MSTATKTPRKGRSRSSKKEEFISSLSGYSLLGEVVTWALHENRGLKNTHSEVVAALKSAGLDEKVARAFLPAQAFSRACQKLKEERVIDELRSDKDEILFQFSRRHTLDDSQDGGQEYEYRKEVKILLNKSSGDLTCKDSTILEQARKELDRCMEERTTSDVSNIVTKLFEAHADLIPIGTGVFFVPQQFASFADQAHSFLKSLGRKMTRLPVPAGTQLGDQSVQEAMASHFDGLLSELEKRVEEFDLTTRTGTVESVASKINTARAKIEAYAAYLQDKSGDLLKKVSEADAKLIARVQAVEEERKIAPPSEKGSNRQQVFAVLSKEPKTVKMLCDEAGVNTNGIGAFLDALVAKERVVKEPGGYRLA